MAAPNRVLVADDWLDLGESVSALLEGQGFAVRWAAAPKEAIRLAKSFRPQFALIDLQFDKTAITGFHVCQWFERRMPDCVRIAHTGHAEERMRLKLQASGFHRVLLKPCTLYNLLSVLQGRPPQVGGRNHDADGDGAHAELVSGD
jgi:two-component system nitrogen regulation response regulator NtrX